MNTMFVLTLHLAQALGLYMILLGLSGLAAPRRWQAMMDELAASAALQMIMGVLVFAIGVTLALIHSILADPLAIVVTLIGALHPHLGDHLADPGLHHRLSRPCRTCDGRPFRLISNADPSVSSQPCLRRAVAAGLSLTA